MIREEGDDKIMKIKMDDDFVENSDVIDLYFKELNYLSEVEGDLLTIEEERELGYRILKGDMDAMNTMIKRNLRLVIDIAKHYRNLGLDFSDLIQLGNMGLMVAVERYDARKGYKFSTYATNWIQHYIRRGLGNESKNIRLPIHFYEELRKYNAVKNKMVSQYGEVPTDEELAEELDVSLEKINKYKINSGNTLSLNFLKGEDSDTETIELIPSDVKTPEEEILDIDLKEKIDRILSSDILTPRELEIIRLRFGFEEKVYTLEEIGQKMGVTRERIRQIEQRALKKLRNYKIKNLIGAYLPTSDIENKDVSNNSKSYRKSRKR